MNDAKLARVRVAATVVVMLLELAHLAWEYFHGGVVSHHLLAREDLPSISNWWGAVLLPALTWFLVGRIHRRAARHRAGRGSVLGYPAGIVAGFVAALVFGVALSMAFTLGHNSVSSALFFGALLLATVLPLYRAECVLGFVLGMTFTFGAVLPSLVGSVIAAIAALFGFVVHPALRWVVSRFKRGGSTDPVRVRLSGD
ncbi:hypothetical protein ACFQZQ_03850 [Lysobacter koreensis]|uniref:Uncharacterized protein n=1 Tax=Lysobacter koreensis TaxID=266122 RepID=A0ABW2YJ15_9GAMM